MVPKPLEGGLNTNWRGLDHGIFEVIQNVALFSI